MSALDGRVALEDHYWAKRYSSVQFSAWAGYNFETVVHKHADAVLKKLGISGVRCAMSHWQAKVPTDIGIDQAKCRIDLVIDRADQIINLCEIKYSRNPFIVERELIRQVGLRNALFQSITKTKKSLVNVLIISGELAGSPKDGTFANIITGDDLMF